ncbi:MAG: single-stranded DNA-binding protein [Acutalibacteraceae bacterium]
MNNVSLLGRLTADPELKHTQSGTAFTRFSIAVDRNFVKQGEERQADFINIVAWQQRAEMICRYFSKGQRIAITGQIRTGSYTDKDGNKRSSFEVWADNIDFCESKRDSNSNGSGYQNNYQNSYSDSYRQQPSHQEPTAPANTYSSGDTGDFVDMPNDEDLPF